MQPTVTQMANKRHSEANSQNTEVSSDQKIRITKPLMTEFRPSIHMTLYYMVNSQLTEAEVPDHLLKMSILLLFVK